MGESKLSFLKHFNSQLLNDESKYRDWDFFKFWFRAVDIHAPWVNKIHVVTSGHIPSWLETNNKKINLVKHEEIMPSTSLPTFNSQAIELCLNRIEGLSTNFVYFNDDVFLNDRVKVDDFFLNDLPRDIGLLNVITPKRGGIEHAIVNNLEIINEYFNKRKVLKNYFFKFFNRRYGVNNIRIILLILWKDFTGFYEPHTAVSLNKSIFDKVWEKEQVEMNKTVHSKFRSKEDLNFWLIRYWQLCTGNFYPQEKNFSKMYYLNDNNDLLFSEMKSPQHKIICLNDTNKVSDFEKIKNELLQTFMERYSEKSQFEK
ncbi:stealth conserved region 3 domain-containing protein [Enterococcus faecium]|uniref:stealth conserved region 3 domain-containing protein n=1 Tax=Enterococcus faecium TaxID=1352 RepID=UPI0021570871|nr:stealth conserved region 3 domain-containing protein [Enterococcus faecium]